MSRCMSRWLFSCAVLPALLIAPPGASAWESAAEKEARRAVADLRAQSALPSNCERAFTTFWRVYTGPGDRGLVHAPAGPEVGDYFGYGVVDSEPLLVQAQEVCARETGARGDLVARVLKERENRKWRRQQRLKHAERIIGY